MAILEKDSEQKDEKPTVALQEVEGKKESSKKVDQQIDKEGKKSSPVKQVEKDEKGKPTTSNQLKLALRRFLVSACHGQVRLRLCWCPPKGG